jgi:hypothetical protein
VTLTVSVDHPHLAKGELVSVGGLLAVPNGESVEVGPETEQLFIEANNVSIGHFLSDNEVVTVSGNAEVDWEAPPVGSDEEEAPDGGYMMGSDGEDVVSKALGEGGEE